MTAIIIRSDGKLGFSGGLLTYEISEKVKYEISSVISSVHCENYINIPASVKNTKYTISILEIDFIIIKCRVSFSGRSLEELNRNFITIIDIKNNIVFQPFISHGSSIGRMIQLSSINRSIDVKSFERSLLYGLRGKIKREYINQIKECIKIFPIDFEYIDNISIQYILKELYKGLTIKNTNIQSIILIIIIKICYLSDFNLHWVYDNIPVIYNYLKKPRVEINMQEILLHSIEWLDRKNEVSKILYILIDISINKAGLIPNGPGIFFDLREDIFWQVSYLLNFSIEELFTIISGKKKILGKMMGAAHNYSKSLILGEKYTFVDMR